MPVPAFAAPLAVVVMGVSGCGKTSVGERLAALARVPFVEGDRLHTAANIEKMSSGIPLTDADRWPWLDIIGAQIRSALDRGAGAVFSCSSLKKSYRDVLRTAAVGRLAFVSLEGSRAVLLSRMSVRQGHFMPVSLLDDQLRVFEPPDGEPGVVTVDIDNTLDDIVRLARAGLAELEKNEAR